jgi:OmpA-OmpF porin, OOP family
VAIRWVILSISYWSLPSSSCWSELFKGGGPFRVAGYTSASGTEAYNQKLSERRANAVQEYLINEGVISPDRLSTIGYGETNPAMYEAAPKEIYSKAAMANMRVLFEIIMQ